MCFVSCVAIATAIMFQQTHAAANVEWYLLVSLLLLITTPFLNSLNSCLATYS